MDPTNLIDWVVKILGSIFGILVAVEAIKLFRDKALIRAVLFAGMAALCGWAIFDPKGFVDTAKSFLTGKLGSGSSGGTGGTGESLIDTNMRVAYEIAKGKVLMLLMK